jgi:hypothetical protein
VFSHLGQQLLPLLRRGSRNGLEVAPSETDVRKDSCVANVKVQERPRPEVEVRRIPSDVPESLDLAKSGDKIRKAHAITVNGRVLADPWGSAVGEGWLPVPGHGSMMSRRIGAVERNSSALVRGRV